MGGTRETWGNGAVKLIRIAAENRHPSVAQHFIPVFHGFTEKILDILCGRRIVREVPMALVFG